MTLAVDFINTGSLHADLCLLYHVLHDKRECWLLRFMLSCSDAGVNLCMHASRNLIPTH